MKVEEDMHEEHERQLHERGREGGRGELGREKTEWGGILFLFLFLLLFYYYQHLLNALLNLENSE